MGPFDVDAVPNAIRELITSESNNRRDILRRVNCCCSAKVPGTY